MSLLDDVSIVVTPNGYKAGELYAVIPVPTEGAEMLSQPVDLVTDFLVNSGGVIVDADTFDTFGGTYDGIRINSFFTIGTRYKLTIQGDTTSSGFTIGDTSGSGNQYGSGFGTFYFTAVGNGSLWIRQQTSGTTNITSFSIKEYTAADMDVTRATDATRVDENGLIEDVLSNVPRIDYTGGGCPHILAEPQRTNLIPYSEDFSDSSWFKANTTISSYSTTSPSGETNASTIVSTSGTSEQYIDVGSLSVTSGEDYTMSCFVKKKDYDFFLIRFTGAGGAFTAGDVFFNINNGTLGTVSSGFSGTITDFGNGWYKCSATTTAASTTGSGKVRLQLASSDNIYTIAGDGSSGTFVWGTQLEEGSYATSYIPTSGSTVTRNQDIFTRDGIGSLINDSEGVLFVEIERSEEENSYRLLGLDDGTSQNYIKMGFGDISGNFWIRVVVNGVTVINSDNAVSNNPNQFYKIAVRYKSGNSVIYIDGVPVLTSSTTFSSGTFTDLNFTHYTGVLNFYGKVKQLQVYDTSLSDEQLLQLTGESGTDFYESYAEMASALTYTIQ